MAPFTLDQRPGNDRELSGFGKGTAGLLQRPRLMLQRLDLLEGHRTPAGGSPAFARRESKTLTSRGPLGAGQRLAGEVQITLPGA